jgi:hypothetical protein
MSGWLMLMDVNGPSTIVEYGDMGKEEHRLACHQLLKFHMQLMFDFVKGDSELTEAMYLLESAIGMVKGGRALMVAEHHLRRVRELVIGDGKMRLHLGFVNDCVHVMHANM